MEEDDMVMSIGNSLVQERDEPMRRTRGLQARGAYKEVPRTSRRLALAAPVGLGTVLHGALMFQSANKQQMEIRWLALLDLLHAVQRLSSFSGNSI